MLKMVALALSGTMLVLGGGFGVEHALKHDVTVVVDGDSTQVSTSASTVAGVLIAEGVKLGEHDAVTPEPAAAVEEGQRIDVRYGREVTANIDGTPTTFWTTARTVADAIAQLDMRSPNFTVSTSRGTSIGRDGLEFDIDTYTNVTVVAGGKTQRVQASGTVADALAAANVTTDDDDRVSQDLNVALKEGMKITVVKVDFKTKTRKTTIDHSTTTQRSSALDEGVTTVKVEGEDGVKTQTIKIRYEDGKKISQTVTSSKVTTKPVTEVKLVGTKTPSTSTSTSGSSSSSSSITPASGSTCGASYYTTGAVTANGEAFNTFGFTAAHKTLPFGTKVKVTNTATGLTTTVRINDRGPFVSDRCLDLTRAAMAAIGGISAGVITVEYEIL